MAEEQIEVSVRSLSGMQSDSLVNSTIQALEELANLEEEQQLSGYSAEPRSLGTQNLSEFEAPETRVPGVTRSQDPACTLPFKETTPLTLPDQPEYLGGEVEVKDVVPPSGFSAQAPTAPLINEHEAPTAPKSEMPEAPTMRDLVLPEIGELSEIEFTGMFPDDLYATPDIEFFYVENDYTSDLLDILNARLLSYVSGTSTGLAAEIEQALFDTFRDDIELVTKRTVRTMNRAWGAAGWSMPSGGLREGIYEVEDEAGREKLKESRKIAKEQATLEQKNLHLAISKSIEVESSLLTYSNLYNQRAFDAAKHSVQVVVDLYKLKVERFLARHKAAGVRASVYADRVQAELSKLELYKVKIEKQALISEANSTDVKLYTEQVKAVTSMYGLYRVEIEGVNAELENDRLLILEYGSKAASYYSEVKAKSNEYKRYKTELDSELTKMVSHSTDSEVFKKKMEAYHSMAQALESEKKIEVKIEQEIPIDVCIAKSKKSNSQYEALINEIRKDAAEVRLDAELYEGQLAAEVTEFGSKVALERANTKVDAARISLNVDVARVNQAAGIASAAVSTEAGVASQRVAAQHRASEISSLSVNTSFGKATNVSASDSASTSHSDSKSYSGTTSTSSVTIYTDDGGTVNPNPGCPF